MEKQYFTGVAKRVEFSLTEIGVGVTGQTVILNIRRNSDGKWLKSDLTWQATIQNISMTERDSTNEKGLYYYDWTPDAAGEYELTYSIASGTYTTSITECVVVSNAIRSDVREILGISVSGNDATLNLKQLNIVNDSGSAIHAETSAVGFNGLNLKSVTQALNIETASNFEAIRVFSSGAQAMVLGSTGASVIKLVVGSGNGHGVEVEASGTGSGAKLSGGTSGHGLELVGAASKNDISAKEIVDIKGTGFVKDTDSLVNLSHKAGTKGTDAIWTLVNALVSGASATTERFAGWIKNYLQGHSRIIIDKNKPN